MHVLLIETQNIQQQESLFLDLEEQGYWVGLAHTSELAIEKVVTIWPNVVIINSAGGGIDIDHTRQALQDTNLDIPYLIVDRGHVSPIGKSSLLVSIDNLKQFHQKIENAISSQKDRFLRLPTMIVDCWHRQVLRQGHAYSLTPKEFKLLDLLLKNKNEILSRKTIMQEVWETDYMGDTRTLDVHIRWLREKIEENPSQPKQLLTVRGVGYRFVVESEAG